MFLARAGSTAVYNSDTEAPVRAPHLLCAIGRESRRAWTQMGPVLAEVIKSGVIVDAPFFDWLEEHVDDLRRLDSAALTHAIRRSCEIKAAIVAEDEREQGRRALLNLGHR